MSSDPIGARFAAWVVLGLFGCSNDDASSAGSGSGVGVAVEIDESPTGALHTESWAHDFGEMFLDERQSTVFTLRNASTSALGILEVRSSCGCIALRGQEARVLGPGETFDLEVELHASKGLGPMLKTVRLRTDEPEADSHYTLRCTADVRALFECEPSVVDFGEVVQGLEPQRTVQVAILDATPFGLLKPESCETLALEVVERPAEDRAVLSVIFHSARAKVGPFLGMASAVCQHPRQPVLRIPVRAQVIPAVFLEPAEQIRFGDTPRAVGAWTTVILRRRIADLEVTPKAPVFETTLGASLRGQWGAWQGDERTLTLEILPEAPSGPFQGAVLVDTGLAGIPVAVLSIHGKVVAD